MSRSRDITSDIRDAISAVSDDLDADVILYDGGIDMGCDYRIVKQIATYKTRPNAALLMTTPGGLPDVAYKIARCIQSKYENFIVIVDSYCKSAGTLISVGANEIVLSDLAELGPLDIQIAKHDELAEYISGLMPVQALSTLRSETFKTFEEYFLNIVERSYGQITAMSAAQLATRLTTECYAAIYGHIDPMRLGEYERAMNIMFHYGMRLDQGNLREGALLRLITDYPSHGFVIDRKEAEQLFKMIREPNEAEERLSRIVRSLSATIREKEGRVVIEFLGPRSRIVPANPKEDKANARNQGKRKGGGSRGRSASPQPDHKVPPRSSRKKLVSESSIEDDSSGESPAKGNGRGSR